MWLDIFLLLLGWTALSFLITPLLIRVLFRPLPDQPRLDERRDGECNEQEPPTP